MAYFANGEEGDMYEELYCSRCAHRRDPEQGECCPVLMLHLLWNYEQCDGDGHKGMALGLFIPREGTTNQQCEMFVEDKAL